MALIHFIDGEKGGVGKSLFARVMVHYCLDREYPFVLVEADRSNPDVGEVYPDVCEQIIFSEAERKSYDADKIFKLALTKPVIVNLPAQVADITKEWIERNGILKLGEKYGVKICKWFVCTGGYDSVKLCIESLNYFDNKIIHVFVRNWGLCEDWTHVDKRKELQDLIAKYNVAVIDFPKFSYPERDYMDEYRCTFELAQKDQSDESLDILGKQRLYTFLDKAFQGIDKAGIWNQSAASQEAIETSSKGSKRGRGSAKNKEQSTAATQPDESDRQTQVGEGVS